MRSWPASERWNCSKTTARLKAGVAAAAPHPDLRRGRLQSWTATIRPGGRAPWRPGPDPGFRSHRSHPRALRGFAADGYEVIAPSFFDRQARGLRPATSRRRRQGGAYSEAAPWDQVQGDLQAAVETLLGDPSTSVGYCWGGTAHGWPPVAATAWRRRPATTAAASELDGETPDVRPSSISAAAIHHSNPVVRQSPPPSRSCRSIATTPATASPRTAGPTTTPTAPASRTCACSCSRAPAACGRAGPRHGSCRRIPGTPGGGSTRACSRSRLRVRAQTTPRPRPIGDSTATHRRPPPAGSANALPPPAAERRGPERAPGRTAGRYSGGADLVFIHTTSQAGLQDSAKEELLAKASQAKAPAVAAAGVGGDSLRPACG